MSHMTSPHRQRGATLIVGLIMLVLITLMMVTAFMMSSTNLKSVGNMQYRDESSAAANAAIEQVISSSAVFITPAAQTVTVGNYSVIVAAPNCLYATKVESYGSEDPNAGLFNEGGGGGGGGGSTKYLDTYWDVTATVNDVMSGTSVETHQGIKITLPSDPNPCP